jgi:hypothetical protein
MERLAIHPLTAPAPAARPPRAEIPTRLSTLVFALKVMAFQARRLVRDLAGGPRRHPVDLEADFPVVLSQSRTPLWTDADPHERLHQRGKVHNLRRAAASLDRVLVPAGQVLGFWRQVGRTSRRRGYVSGRMLQQGCLVASTGGGLCQLSNALYQAALDSGCEIVERHGHSRVVPGSAAAWGRDATVAWNYVDLRFRHEQRLLIEARLSAEELIVRFRAPAGAPRPRRRLEPAAGAPSLSGDARDCGGCGETGCHRHEAPPAVDAALRTGFILDETWPEHQAHVARSRGPHDLIAAPLAGLAYAPRRHRWPVDGFERVGSAPLQALARAAAIRLAGHDAPRRRAAELEGAGAIARRLARLAGPDIDRLCVAQSLLPFLWREGVLGGRPFEVLMSRLPIAELQARLDAAFTAHPERVSLGDFRADPWVARAETEALAAAERIVTPHAAIAALFPGRALLLPWRAPRMAPPSIPPVLRIAFPGPTAARKGAWEVREAARRLGLEVVPLGSELEGPGFWDGVEAAPPPGAWLDGVAAVVQPAVIEDQPRRLLAALSAGVPVVATEACGLGERPGLTLVAQGDAEALAAALRAVLGAR